MTWWMVVICCIILLFGFVVVRGAPYVPSHRRFVRLALTKLYELSEKDVLVDLGSGDGIVLRLAAERASHVIGYELNPALVGISKLLARGNPNIETRIADFWLVDLPVETTVVYAFIVTRDVAKLEKKMQATVDEWGHSVWLITYGAQLKTKQPTEILHAHSLYLFDPEKN
ncbi:MAG: hypothetical protein JWN75_442 [Candidatus Saccharibacteria bacterium]|nr:hypothetical protein [Candidatus Saccharibacteria bacterium]